MPKTSGETTSLNQCAVLLQLLECKPTLVAQIGSASRRHRLQFCEPTGMRALAPCPWLAGSSSAVDGRRPGRTLVARLRQPNHSQSCTKMAQGPCWGRSTFHLLHTGHARGRIVSSMLTISRISHPFGQCVGAIGDVLCLPCGREISTPSAVSLSLQRFPPPHSRLASALRRRILLDSLCHGEGIFHGLPCLATNDSLGMCH